jgi:hypothetical protein
MSADKKIMSAAIAMNLQQTFNGLMSRPARLGDIELTASVQPAPAPKAGAVRPTVDPAFAPF